VHHFEIFRDTLRVIKVGSGASSVMVMSNQPKKRNDQGVCEFPKKENDNSIATARPVTGPSRRNVTLKRVSVVDRPVQLSLNWQDVQNTRSCLIRI
jgi:hypothetical protein